MLESLHVLNRSGVPVHPEIPAFGFLLVIIAAFLSVCGHIKWWPKEQKT